MNPIRLVDGYKLCSLIEDEIESLASLKDDYSRGARHYNSALLKEIQSGRFDIPSDQGEAEKTLAKLLGIPLIRELVRDKELAQGEATRLREALDNILFEIEIPVPDITLIKRLCTEALSSKGDTEPVPVINTEVSDQ